MKRTLAAIAITAAALLAIPAAAPEARADMGIFVQIGDHGGKHDGWRKHGRHGKHHHKGHREHRRDHRWDRHDGRHHGRHHHRRHDRGGVVLRFGFPQPHVQRPCHVVERDGHFYGRPARVGETLCYDGYGRPYTVEGSTFLIGYY